MPIKRANLMKKNFFHQTYMELALTLAKRSHCIKKQVGAVLMKDTRVVSTGYNGPPPSTPNCDEVWPKTGCPRSLRGGGCVFAIHAEQNAILYALQNQVDLTGSTIYTTLSPCLSCARLIFGAGIQEVHYYESYANFKGPIGEEGIQFLKHFGVSVYPYTLHKAYTEPIAPLGIKR